MNPDHTTRVSGTTGIADIEAMERMPLAERALAASTYEALAAGLSTKPDAPALSFFLNAKDHKHPTVWTQAELLGEIHRAANTFRSLGVQRGDVVAFVLPNLPETHLVIWGAETAGIAFAINPMLDAEQMGRLLSAGNAKWLVTLAPTPGSDVWERAAQAATHAKGLHGILTVSLAPYVSGIARLVVRIRAKARKAPDALPPVTDFRTAMANANANARSLDFAPPRARDISSYFCTGGTTGLPKIAMRTHASEVFDSWAMQSFVEGAFAPGRSIFCGLPLFHVNGQLVTGLAPWSQGAHVVLGTPQGYRGEGVLSSFWSIAEHYRIVAFSGVPTVYSALLAQPTKNHDISSIEYGMCGAAPMPEELFRSFQDATGIRILEAYGLTEGACVSSVNPPAAPPRIGSVGIRLPYQRMSVAILDDSGAFARFAEVDEPGAVLISGPNVFAGYVDPSHNEGIWIDADGARWFHTGDLARQDVDGYFWLTGRQKELIIRGGHNIDPKVIEEPMHEHPAVALAAAVARPDAHAGEVPVVYVQLSPGASATEEELAAFVVERIGERTAQPKAVRIVAELPTTSVGKIFKPALTMREIDDVIRDAAHAAHATLVQVEVVQDSARGMVARVRTSGDDAALRAELDRFAFRVEYV